MPSLGALLALKDKDSHLTLDAIVGLPLVQVNIVKQLANALDKAFGRQILNKQLEVQNQTEEGDEEMEDESQSNVMNQF